MSFIPVNATVSLDGFQRLLQVSVAFKDTHSCRTCSFFNPLAFSFVSIRVQPAMYSRAFCLLCVLFVAFENGVHSRGIFVSVLGCFDPLPVAVSPLSSVPEVPTNAPPPPAPPPAVLVKTFGACESHEPTNQSRLLGSSLFLSALTHEAYTSIQPEESPPGLG